MGTEPTGLRARCQLAADITVTLGIYAVGTIVWVAGTLWARTRSTRWLQARSPDGHR